MIKIINMGKTVERRRRKAIGTVECQPAATNFCVAEQRFFIINGQLTDTEEVGALMKNRTSFHFHTFFLITLFTMFVLMGCVTTEVKADEVLARHYKAAYDSLYQWLEERGGQYTNDPLFIKIQDSGNIGCMYSNISGSQSYYIGFIFSPNGVVNNMIIYYMRAGEPLGEEYNIDGTLTIDPRNCVPSNDVVYNFSITKGKSNPDTIAECRKTASMTLNAALAVFSVKGVGNLDVGDLGFIQFDPLKEGEIHTYQTNNAVEPSCTQNGYSGDKTCTLCGFGKQGTVVPAGHKLVATPAKAATYTEPGNRAYWTCSSCGKYFSDKNGEVEITEGSWIIPVNQNASGDGTTMSRAVNIEFAQSYTKSWNSSNDHLNHYCRIAVPSKGIITINATKPWDSEGEYGRLEFTLFTEAGDPIWGNNTRTTKDFASDFYTMKVGLNTGIYYLTIKPGFTVSSGNITTNYSVKFKEDVRCEIEPNESISQGTVMQPGTLYTGYYGRDFSSYGHSDYWRVQLEADTTYKVAIGNYATISNTTSLIYIYDPDGTRKSIRNYLDKSSDENGMSYVLYTTKAAGLYSICLDNYLGNQYEYTLSVTKFEKKAQQIRGVSTSITKYKNDSTFTLNATAMTDLSYNSSNTLVASVGRRSGEVHLWRAGTTVITVTAAETDVYKPASIQITITVIDPATGSQSPSSSYSTPSYSTPSTPSYSTPSYSPRAQDNQERITIVTPPASVKAKAKKNKVTVTWKKIKKTKKTKALLAQIKSIEVQYSTDKAFKKDAKIKTVGKKKTKVTLKLQKKTTYYIRVRYKAADGFSKWSKAKKVKTKK